MGMQIENSTPDTLQAAIIYFADPATAHDFMVALRWPNGVICPHCSAVDVTFMAKRRVWQCKAKECRRQFSAKVGTIFEDSPLGLDKWLPCVWLIANCKNGISSYEVGRALGVTQKTAWFMLHRIRLAMQTPAFGKFGGNVEIDETFIGGKSRFMHHERRQRAITGTGGAGKVAVMGILEREGRKHHSRVRVSVVPNTRKRAISAFNNALNQKTSVLTKDTAKHSAMLADISQGLSQLAQALENDMLDIGSRLKRLEEIAQGRPPKK